MRRCVVHKRVFCFRCRAEDTFLYWVNFKRHYFCRDCMIISGWWF